MSIHFLLDPQPQLVRTTSIESITPVDPVAWVQARVMKSLLGQPHLIDGRNVARWLAHAD